MLVTDDGSKQRRRDLLQTIYKRDRDIMTLSPWRVCLIKKFNLIF